MMTFLPLPNLRLSAILTLTASALALPTAPAAAQSGEIVFVDLGRWTIYQATRAGYCEMRLRSGVNGSLVLRKRAGSPGNLRLTLNNAGRGFGSEVTFRFDEVQFGGALLNGRTYAPSIDSSAIEAEFRRAETMSVLQGGATVASVSLKSSAAGWRLLNQCAEQWRTSFIPARQTRVASAPPPAARNPLPTQPRSNTQSLSASRFQQPAQPQATGPYPPNRAVSPRNQSSWIRSEDFRRLPELRGDGTITFSLLVNEEGRVEECSVLKSSGSRQLDGRTCRTLQRRAQFDPATNANGDAIEATYSSNVQFDLGD